MTDRTCPASTPAATAARRADSILGARYRATTGAMVSLVALGAFEAMAVAAAMPSVVRALAGVALYALAFSATLAGSVVGMTIAGRGCDRHGPARMLALGMVCFVAGLLAAGLAPGMPQLIAGRLLQGVGSGAYVVALYVLVGRLYPPALRPQVLAAFSAGWVVPSLVGPSVAGWIVGQFGWRWVFLAVPMLAVPITALLWPAIRTQGRVGGAATAHAGALGWAIAAAAAILSISVGARLHGAGAAALVVLASALTAVCAWRLLPAGTLRLARGLPTAVALRGITAAAFYGVEAFLPLLLTRERALSPWLAGLALSVGALGWSAGSWLQGRRRLPTQRTGLPALGVRWLLLGLAINSGALWPAFPVVVAIAGWGLCGVGMGLLLPSLSVLALANTTQQGRSSAALQLGEAISVASVLAIAGTLFALLLPRVPAAAYLGPFALCWLLAVASHWLVQRL
ncbi:MFS transporter [Xanthomonas maliensis]|uniref:MFS transporter n=1 Tax=Xanthomonas maliensis TaxID=1321368 RepID=UPI0004CF6CDD|nr:MFS transporter [Xanthomonas maliensis]KAB7763769.1 MFS transporter [Xanthomonas maliensis]